MITNHVTDIMRPSTIDLTEPVASGRSSTPASPRSTPSHEDRERTKKSKSWHRNNGEFFLLSSSYLYIYIRSERVLAIIESVFNLDTMPVVRARIKQSRDIFFSSFFPQRPNEYKLENLFEEHIEGGHCPHHPHAAVVVYQHNHATPVMDAAICGDCVTKILNVAQTVRHGACILGSHVMTRVEPNQFINPSDLVSSLFYYRYALFH